MIGRTFWCISCDKKVNIVASEKQWLSYQEGKVKIQDIFPDLSAGDREILITGMCGDCFDNIFK
jgi:hypothetical protein